MMGLSEYSVPQLVLFLLTPVATRDAVMARYTLKDLRTFDDYATAIVSLTYWAQRAKAACSSLHGVAPARPLPIVTGPGGFGSATPRRIILQLINGFAAHDDDVIIGTVRALADWPVDALSMALSEAMTACTAFSEHGKRAHEYDIVVELAREVTGSPERRPWPDWRQGVGDEG